MVIVTLLLAVLLAAAAAVAYVMRSGLTARAEPGPLETRVARAVRSLAVPRAVRDRRNPVPQTPESLQNGLAHFADHCAVCHGSDGSGDAEIGRNLFPRPPDMRTAATQGLSDGSLFYIIENGVRFTGMPAFATGDAAGEDASWELVHVIRRLPHLSEEDIRRIETMIPRSPAEIRQEIDDEEFLRGGPGSTADSDHQGHGR